MRLSNVEVHCYLTGTWFCLGVLFPLNSAFQHSISYIIRRCARHAIVLLLFNLILNEFVL